MVSVRNRMIATTLSVILATSPLLGCGKVAQDKNSDPKNQDDMVKDDEQEQGKTIPYSKKGEYTVTLQEGDFTKGEDEGQAPDDKASDKSGAADAEEIARPDQDEAAGTETQAKLDEAKAALEQAKQTLENERAALDQAKEAEEQAKGETEAAPQNTETVTLDADAQNTNDAEQQKSEALSHATEAREQAEANLAQAEEAVAAAELKVQELEGDNGQAGTEASADKQADEKQEKKSLAFGDMKLENVKVYYDTITNRKELKANKSGEVEPQYEEREAQIKALSNDNGAMTLSFVDPDAASNATDTYYVVIDDLRLYTPIHVDIPQPMLTTDSTVACNSKSADVTITAEDGTFASDLSASDLKLGGSFNGMKVAGVETSADALTVHLTGTPKLNYKVSSTYMDGQITVPASGFENTACSATAYVPIDLPEEAFDLGDAEALAPATAIGDVDYASVDGDTGKATVYLQADLGAFNDVKPENITLEDAFAGGKVESVSKEGEDGDLLKVDVSFPTSGVDENDYNLAGTIKLAAGAMTDEKGNAAPEVESTVAVSSGEDMGKAGDDDDIIPVDTNSKIVIDEDENHRINQEIERLGEEDSLSSSSSSSESDSSDKKDSNGKSEKPAEKKKSSTDETLGAAGVGFKYAGKWLKKVDPTLAKLSNVSGELFNLAGNIVAGKWSKVVENGIGLLKLCGISPDDPEITAADVLEEVKGLRTVVNSIDAKVSDISKEDREDRFTQTSVRLKKLQDYCASADAMLVEGAKILATRKKNPMQAPGENATKEEIAKYNAALRGVMIKEMQKEKNGDKLSTMFADLDTTMENMRDELSTVTKWVSVEKTAFNAGANPIDIYDKLVSSRFNWDSQGYYARLAFRGELTYTIETAWAAISTYYNTNDPKVKHKYQPEADNVAAALAQIEARPAGTSPEQVRELNQAGKDFKLYSPSLGYSIKRSRLVNGGLECSKESDERTSNDKINEYKNRLQGSLYEDLQLAGLESGDENTKFDGIGFRHNISWVRSRPITRYGRLTSSGVPYTSVEAWTLMVFQDKSASAKKTFRGTQVGGKPVTGDKWYTFYWFDRA